MKEIFRKAAYGVLMTAAAIGGVAIFLKAAKNDYERNNKPVEYVTPAKSK